VANLAVRDIDPDHYRALAEQARNNRRSIAAEVREWMSDIARRHRATQLVTELRELRDNSKWTLPDGMTSLDLLREERESS
jgi:hypothetical protein